LAYAQKQQVSAKYTHAVKKNLLQPLKVVGHLINEFSSFIASTIANLVSL
jgi:hypothetical protein